MRNELGQWYKRREASHHENLTSVHDMTLRSFGTKADRKCNFSGAEAWGVLLFLVETLQKHRAREPAEAE
eukprot:369733-Alexandrium_andersonii.AAC.1